MNVLVLALAVGASTLQGLEIWPGWMDVCVGKRYVVIRQEGTGGILQWIAWLFGWAWRHVGRWNGQRNTEVDGKL